MEDISESLEDRVMRMVQEEIYEESGGEWRPWCANGKSLRVGGIIPIVDADTIVPEVCFHASLGGEGLELTGYVSYRISSRTQLESWESRHSTFSLKMFGLQI